jgi:excisionase family DNA binding protein
MVRTVFVDEAARLLGVSRRTVYYRIRQGRLRTIKTLGGSRRVLLESISALLREELAARRGQRPSASDRASEEAADACADDTVTTSVTAGGSSG